MNTANNPPKPIFQYRPTPSISDRALWNERVYGYRHSVAASLHSIDFQFVITVCPNRLVSVPQMKDMASRFMESARSNYEYKDKGGFGDERKIAYLVGYAVAYEFTPSNHIHLCLVSRPRLSVGFIREAWRKIVGSSPKSIDIKTIDPSSKPDAMAYFLKTQTDPERYPGEWELSDNIEQFRPRARARRNNHRINQMKWNMRTESTDRQKGPADYLRERFKSQLSGQRQPEQIPVPSDKSPAERFREHFQKKYGAPG